jgi:hypothetical protein
MAGLAFALTWISVNDELPGVKIRTHGRQTNCQKSHQNPGLFYYVLPD